MPATTSNCSAIIHKALDAVCGHSPLINPRGIHGLGHWSRVWLHGRMLARELGLNPQILAWFAFLHDSRRRNDHRDPRHGQRAADFAVELRRTGVITELSPHEFEFLCEAMRLHSDGYTTGETVILACWDADRLDLARVGIVPEVPRLCTSPARNSIERAVRLATPKDMRPPDAAIVTPCPVQDAGPDQGPGLDAVIALMHSVGKADGTVAGPVSLVQRHFRLGYGAGLELVSRLEALGVLSGALDDSGRRKLLDRA